MSDDVNDRFFDPEDYRASAAMRGGKKSEIEFLRIEAENMALSLEAAGYGRHQGGKMCTPLERYRAKFPKK